VVTAECSGSQQMLKVLSRWAGYVARMERCDIHKKLVGKREGTRPIGRQRRRREDNIKTDVRKIR